MLSPKKPRVLLLPEEERMLKMLGWTHEQYRWFCRQSAQLSGVKPGEPVAFDLTFFVVTLVVGIALNYAASLLAPRQQASSDPARIEPRRVDGQNIVDSTRFASRSSFTGLQNVVELNSPIGIIYSKREAYDDIYYGGVRVNTNLIWSQLWSVAGSQLFRGIFLVGEGPIQIDVFQTAMGDNLFGSYDLKPADSSNDYGRVTFYYNDTGGPIDADRDYAAGRWYTHDTANSSGGGGEVFLVKDVDNVNKRKFVYSFKPQTQTQFGVYAPMGVGLGYRVNPKFQPAVTPSLQPKGDVNNPGDAIVLCSFDVQRVAERDQQNATYSGRTTCQVTSGASSDSVSKGDIFRYDLSAGSDYGTSHTVTALGGSVIGQDGKVEHDAAAQSIAARQRGWDENLIVGETYQWGEARAICISRDNGRFVSQADSQTSNSVWADFRVIEGGAIQEYTTLENFGGAAPRNHGDNGTQNAHLFRCAIASFSIDRPCRHIEIGLRSTLGIRYNGMVDWGSAKPYENGVPNGSPSDNLDWQACFFWNNQTVAQGQIFAPQVSTSGTYTGVDIRYSFFHVRYREITASSGASDGFTRIRRTFGTRGSTGEAIFNYLTIFFPYEARWEIQIVPVTGWQIRKNKGIDKLAVLDGKRTASNQTHLKHDLDEGGLNGLYYRFTGDDTVDGDQDWFLLEPTRAGRDLSLDNQDPGEPDDPNIYTYVDSYGKVAEMFWYAEVESSCGSVPEHEITYVDVVSENPSSIPNGPLYTDMAMLGMNLRSRLESNDLGQVSVYVNSGLGDEHLFPNCLKDLLTNKRYGAGNVFPLSLIDENSFSEAAEWTRRKRYFFDIAISQPINLVTQANEWANYFLLDLGKSGGRFTLSPTANFADDGPHPIIAMFSSGNILELNLAYRDQQAREPSIYTVKWRFEDQVAIGDNTGIFPVLKELSVRESSTPQDANVIEIDVSDFCTSEYQALDIGKMQARKTRLVTHDINLKTYPDVVSLYPGAIIKVAMETLAYAQPRNGVILDNGRIVCTEGTLEDADYDVVLWTGTGDNVQQVTLSVVDGVAVSYRNAIFSVGASTVFAQTYKVESVDYDSDGNVDVAASYFPLNDQGLSILTENWEDAGSWSISPSSLLPPRPEPPVPFTGVVISGPIDGVRNTSYLYTSTIFGDLNANYSYQWAASNGTLTTPTSDQTQFSADITGNVAITLTVTDTDTLIEKSDSTNIELIDEPIRSITLTGAPTVASGFEYGYDVTIDKPPYVATAIQWTLDPQIGTIIGGDTSSECDILVDSNAAGQTGFIYCQVTHLSLGIVKNAAIGITVYSTRYIILSGAGTAATNSTILYKCNLFGIDPATTTFAWTEI